MGHSAGTSELMSVTGSVVPNVQPSSPISTMPIEFHAVQKDQEPPLCLP